MGVNEIEANVRNKIGRGKFSAAFTMHILEALGVETIRLQAICVKRLDPNIIAVAIIFSATAFFIAVLFNVSFQPNYGQASPSSHSQQYDSRTDEQQPPDKSTVVQTEDGIESESFADIGQRNNQEGGRYPLQNYDHYSQIAMAFLALAGLVIGLVGLYFLWRTVVFTKRAATSSDMALEVANKTLEATVLATQLELQPYLSAAVEGVKIIPQRKTKSILGDAVEFGFSVDVAITNTGKTPVDYMFINAGATSRIYTKTKRDGPSGAPSIFDHDTNSFVRKTHITTMGEPSLAAGGIYKRSFNVTFKVREKDFEGVDTTLNDFTSHFFTFGMRLSFIDRFTESAPKDGRYARRVLAVDFGHLGKENTFDGFSFGLEMDPENVDYPEEHNRRDKLGLLRAFGSGSLGAIVLRDTLP